MCIRDRLCTLYDDYGLIAYANTKGAAVQQLYNNLQERKATVEDALRFLLSLIHISCYAWGVQDPVRLPAAVPLSAIGLTRPPQSWQLSLIHI